MKYRISINNQEIAKNCLKEINDNIELNKSELQKHTQDNLNYPCLKIIIVIDTYNNSSGASIATKRLVEELEKRGHSVTVIAAIHDGTNKSKYYKVPCLYLPFGKKNQAELNFRLGKGNRVTLKKAMQNADLIQIQLPFLLGKSAVKVAQELNIPVIAAFHVQPQNILYGIKINSKLLESLLWLFFKYLLFNRVKTIISPSNFAANLLKSKGVMANHFVISNGITNEYKPEPYNKPQLFENKFVVLCIGRFSFEKRYNIIIEAIKQSKYSHNIQLILAGKGELKDELIKLSTTLPVKPIISYISNKDKIMYLNTADIYVHSSLVELESLSTSEAIGCGLPCLISNSIHSAANQFAIDERFLFEADNATHLCEKIDYWYENKTELKSTKLRAKVLTLAKNYNFKTSVDKYEEIYKKTILDGRI